MTRLALLLVLLGGALLAFSLLGVVVTYTIQRLQDVLPFNPQRFSAVSPDSSFNTAVSFTTNTNWQGYAGEATMSYLSQMLGLAWHNFTSAAAGIGVALAMARGITRRARADGGRGVGNFWVDLIRALLYVLLPISVVFALLRKHFGMWTANVLQATVFVSFLWELGYREWGPLLTIPFALVQGWIFSWSKSFTYVVAVHLLFDLVVFGVLVHAHHPELFDVFVTAPR